MFNISRSETLQLHFVTFPEEDCCYYCMFLLHQLNRTGLKWKHYIYRMNSCKRHVQRHLHVHSTKIYRVKVREWASMKLVSQTGDGGKEPETVLRSLTSLSPSFGLFCTQEIYKNILKPRSGGQSQDEKFSSLFAHKVKYFQEKKAICSSVGWQEVGFFILVFTCEWAEKGVVQYSLGLLPYSGSLMLKINLSNGSTVRWALPQWWHLKFFTLLVITEVISTWKFD